MSKWIPITLWVAVVIFGGLLLARNAFRIPATVLEPVDGRKMAEVPWKHTPSLGEFQLTDQNGKEFRSGTEIGKPMLFYFFYATCPTVCRNLNSQVKVFTDEFRNTDMQFCGLTVDPEDDTVDLLKKYYDSFSPETKNWRLLTGQPEELRSLAIQNFRVPWEKQLHTEKLFLVDRWGRIRNWYDWGDTEEIQRLRKDVREVLDEKSPPMDLKYKTRYMMTGIMADLWEKQPWIREFNVTDHNNKKLYSKELTGKVWLASFFFSTCPSVCKKMNQHLSGYQEKLKETGTTLLSISTQGNTDTPVVLKDYRRQFATENGVDWIFSTVDESLVKRISAEFFGAPAGVGHHSTDLFLVDKWGNLRGRFDWRKPEEEKQMWTLVRQLDKETRPPSGFTFQYPSKPIRKYPYEDEEEGAEQ